MTNKPPSGAPDRASPGKLSLSHLAAMKGRGERMAMVTAYDAPSARLADAAGVDVVLVGDSAAMTVLGHDSTVPVTVDEMLMLTRAVSRGAKRAFVVADMPFGSFQISDETALENAIRFVKEGGADAVKLERAGPTLRRVGAILDAGIPVIGHIGLTPQSVKMLGGYKAQGRTAAKAHRLLDDARALERAGCFAVVLEAIPAAVAARITRALTIPTVGIGAGPSCDGQVLVWHDMLGLSTGHVPRFVKQYADIGGGIFTALEAYVADVRAGRFPEAQHTYPMPEDELQLFEAELMAASLGEKRPK
jgi:3-methyl-2-oxobutanoate hydroxymethyltransferase